MWVAFGSIASTLSKGPYIQRTTTTGSMVQDDDEVCAPSGYTVTTGRIVQDDDDAVCAQSGYTVTTGSIVQDDDVHCAPG